MSIIKARCVNYDPYAEASVADLEYRQRSLTLSCNAQSETTMGHNQGRCGGLVKVNKRKADIIYSMFIDLIVGLTLGCILSLFSENHLILIIASAVFSLLPDLDFLIYHSLYPINRFSHRHRRIFHLPVFYILLGLIILWLLDASSIFYVSFIILSLWHFLHDTFSIGYGVQWFYPFTKRHYLWNSNVSTSKKVFKNLHSDTPENIDAHADKNGDDNWVRKSFFK